MLFLQQPLEGRSGVFHREGSPIYTLWTGDLLQVSHRVMAVLTMRVDVLTTHDAEGLGEQPMTIQEAMNKAVEGGYRINSSDGRGHCQVVGVETRIRRVGTPLRSYLLSRRLAPYLSLRPNSRIAAASLDDRRPLRANAVWVGSVGQWAHRQPENAGHDPLI